jgi:two-component system NtrC family sensor kinase
MDVARDVSNRKEIEAHLKAAQSRLTQSIRLASVGELAAGFAHHINNPLTTIIAEAQIMLHKMPADHPVQESAQAIERAGWRVQQAVQRLLDFSRPVPQTLESLSINHTIEEALALVGDHIRSKGITLQTQLAENLPEVRGDARQFQDVWVNLLLLARDAAIPDQPLTITVRSIPHTSGQVAIEVQDDGKLIPPEALNKLFEPNFFNPPGGRGTGLEFGICQEIVSQYNGQIVAESTNQHGTIIRVILPVGNPDDDSQHLDR